MEYPNVLDWLLEESNASVRYYAMRDILKVDDADRELKVARRAIPRSRMVMKILSRQNHGGYWGDADSPYLPKYKASYWQLMLLAGFGMDRRDPCIRRACNHIFSFQHAEGGFSSNTRRTALREYSWHVRRGRVLPAQADWIERHIYEGQLTCLTGNIVAALIRLGYCSDRRVKKALYWLCDVQNHDGGWLCPYWSAHVRDSHGCFYGTISPLEALSEVPQCKRTSAMQEALNKGVAFMLMHSLFKADHHDHRVINRSWLRFAFPWFSSYDILRGMDVVTRLGFVSGKKLGDAIRIIESKRLSNGAWLLERSSTGRMYANIETVGKPSKWVTLIALRVLKRLGRLESALRDCVKGNRLYV